MPWEEVSLALILRITATGKACLQTFLKAIKRGTLSLRFSFALLQKSFYFILKKLPDNDKYLSKFSSGPNPEVFSWYLITFDPGKHPFALSTQVQSFVPVRPFITSPGILLCCAFFDHSKQSKKL